MNDVAGGGGGGGVNLMNGEVGLLDPSPSPDPCF